MPNAPTYPTGPKPPMPTPPPAPTRARMSEFEEAFVQLIVHRLDKIEGRLDVIERQMTNYDVGLRPVG